MKGQIQEGNIKICYSEFRTGQSVLIWQLDAVFFFPQIIYLVSDLPNLLTLAGGVYRKNREE